MAIQQAPQWRRQHQLGRDGPRRGLSHDGQSFRTKLAAELWAARTEAAAKGRTLASSRGMTFGQLLDEALPRLTNPTGAVFAYWREAARRRAARQDHARNDRAASRSAARRRLPRAQPQDD